eukprot:SM000033S12414  [mRNA]  locus=s33:815495:817070:- [translate_table: standard]
MAPAYVVHDFYGREARRLGYVARSAFKLLEIQSRHRVIPPGGSVLDLGSAPGAWLQAACQALGPRGGHVVGVDVKKLEVPHHYCDGRVTVIRADAFELDSALLRELAPKGFSTVLSDMCPPLSGMSASDIAVSKALGQRALELALGSSAYIRALGATDTLQEAQDHHGVLNAGGSLVMKLLEGAGTQDFKGICRSAFGSVTWLRPKATRSASREIYLVAKGRR